MQNTLPDYRELRCTQRPGRVNSKRLETVDQLLLILPTRTPAALWRKIPQGNKLQALLRKRPSGDVPALMTRLTNKRQTLVVAAKTAAGADAFDRLTLGRRLVAAATSEKAGNLGILVMGFDTEEQHALCDAAVAAALAAGFNLAEFKSKNSPPRIRSICVLGLDEKIDLSRTVAEAKGNNLARWLTSMPPNKLDAISYANMLKTRCD